MKEDNAYFEDAGEHFSLLYPAAAHDLLELANEVDELSRSVQGDSQIVSVVSSPIDPNAETDHADAYQRYQLEMRPPLGQSYAREVAARYGISYQQLEDVLTKRGVI